MEEKVNIFHPAPNNLKPLRYSCFQCPLQLNLHGRFPLLLLTSPLLQYLDSGLFSSLPDFPQTFPVLLSFVCGVNLLYSEPTAHFAHSNKRPLWWLLPPWKYKGATTSDYQNMLIWLTFLSLEVYLDILLNDMFSLYLDMQSEWNNANFLHELFLCPINWSLMDNFYHYPPQ